MGFGDFSGDNIHKPCVGPESVARGPMVTTLVTVVTITVYQGGPW